MARFHNTILDDIEKETFTIQDIMFGVGQDNRPNKIYVFRYQWLPLYVGISTTGIYTRFLQHFGKAGDVFRYQFASQIGKAVLLNLPKSASWPVDIIGIEGACKIITLLSPETTLEGLDSEQIITLAESLLIDDIRPCLNCAHNIKPRKIPEDRIRFGLSGEMSITADAREEIERAWPCYLDIAMSEVESEKYASTQKNGDWGHFKITRRQAAELLDNININTTLGARDAAMLALLLCTGMRIPECATLRVSDLFSDFDGSLALLIRKCGRRIARVVPYGDLAWCLEYVRHWLSLAKIKNGSLWGEPMSVRGIGLRIEKYAVDGHTLRPLDLRRTYARWLFDMGMSVESIRINLGQAEIKTTWEYIGTAETNDRIPKERGVVQTPAHYDRQCPSCGATLGAGCT